MSSVQITHELGQRLHEIWRGRNLVRVYITYVPVTGVGAEVELGMGEIVKPKEVAEVIAVHEKRSSLESGTSEDSIEIHDTPSALPEKQEAIMAEERTALQSFKEMRFDMRSSHVNIIKEDVLVVPATEIHIVEVKKDEL